MANDILLFSDIHLHSHKRSTDRLQDGIVALEWVFKSAIKNNIKSVIFCGDLFHDRSKMEILTLCRVYDLFEKYFSSDPPFDLYLLLGNHDLWHRDRWDVHSPAFLRAFDGIKIIDMPCSLNIQNRFIDFLPFTEDPIADLNDLADLTPRQYGEKRMLCSHLAIHGARLNAFTEADVVVEHDGDMIKVDHKVLSGWDQVYLGHYHGEQRLGNNNQIEYIGSTYELTKSEAFQEKHIIIHDLDTFQKRYLVNDFSPKHLILTPEQLDGKDLNRHFVTVMVPDTLSESIKVEMRQEILRDHLVGSLEFKNRKVKSDDDQQQVVKDAKGILETQDKMLERYIAECSDEEKKGLKLDALLKFGMRIIGTDPNNDLSLDETKAALHPLEFAKILNGEVNDKD